MVRVPLGGARRRWGRRGAALSALVAALTTLVTAGSAQAAPPAAVSHRADPASCRGSSAAP